MAAELTLGSYLGFYLCNYGESRLVELLNKSFLLPNSMSSSFRILFSNNKMSFNLLNDCKNKLTIQKFIS